MFSHRSLFITLGTLVSVVILPVILITPSALAQFGVAKKRGDGGSTFSEAQKLAMEQYEEDSEDKANSDMLSQLGDLANMDMSELEALVEEAMKDPETAKMFQDFGQEMESAFAQLQNMDEETLGKNIEEAMKMFEDEDALKSILGDKEKMLDQLAGSGMVDADKLVEYKVNPDKLETDVREAMKQMGELVKDPSYIKQMSEILSNPGEYLESLKDAFGGGAGDMAGLLDNDEKIEEARLQLLENPDIFGPMFSTKEMKEILNDPVKWRESVNDGKNLLSGRDGISRSGEDILNGVADEL